MKLRITISGPKVHDVGYRQFLMNEALTAGIRMFEAYNIEREKEQQVMILLEGDDSEVQVFEKAAKIKHPAKAVVSLVTSENFGGQVMRVGEFAPILAAMQLSRTIPLLREMNDEIKAIKEDVKELKWGMKEVDREVKQMNESVKSLTGI
jgi:acylphosphatase